MTLVLDSTLLIDLDKEKKDTQQRIRELRYTFSGYPTITFITYYEFLFGIRNRNQRNKEKALQFIKTFDVLTMTKETAKILCDLRDNQDKRGKPLPLADLLIAAQIIECNSTLVTQDNDFKNIENLKTIFV